ncbi:hypothetical protein HQ305_21255 [Rhodococcus sp. BP-149]|uniref:hypothetical protein n=1 Tax=unclassified Rhodococcus (in: high G+C Gram-positive bacteria) TaxID=192944 RepID=UPI001C9A9050|nr:MULTISPECIES: hypothetical protein [unclassified Rhodococcus (in: high G+C Gram-positive bacteria)]MBY6687809.1 hypothetical protein [Rhodococcus sp. BP-288]MBY6696074.1 hypothetical protein [Rhodococcus sp. BP-188]MBY6700671.1 hypothetical protein [Rhodococcus sp. BP-285]MBY6705068.1 hypothetical protein [Rhodococcus sp. BP-283]MBY6713796.1 hypothetical protein [Rhodococcus sp. BP-160]
MIIANTIGDVTVSDVAQDLGAVVATLKDLDEQRIAKNDDIVLRKAVLALLELVGRLEERVVRLERAGVDGKNGEAGDVP